MFLAEKLAADASYFHLPMLSEKVLRVLLVSRKGGEGRGRDGGGLKKRGKPLGGSK